MRGHAEFGYADHLALAAAAIMFMGGMWEAVFPAAVWGALHLDRLGLA
jgi:hypothetical protein